MEAAHKQYIATWYSTCKAMLLCSLYFISSVNFGCWASSKMKSLSVAVMLVLIFLLCLGHVTPAAGSGPDKLERPPAWNFTMAQCSLFRNETVLRPFFILWPESIEGVPFRYCCEYQSSNNLSVASFNLSRYSNSPGIESNTLIPAPYYDLGLIDKNFSVYLWHRDYVQHPIRLRAPYRPPLYCEASDLYRLYKHRVNMASVLAFKIALCLIAVLLVGIILFRGSGLIAVWYYKSKFPGLRVELEELFLDLCHIVLLAHVGTFLMEAIGHSNIRDWRSQLMYDSGMVYSALTIVAVYHGALRHGLDPEKWDKKRLTVDFQWKKVFVQLVALCVLYTYLTLVEDVTGSRLDAVAGLVLGAVFGASVFSAIEYEWLAILRAVTPSPVREPKQCRRCSRPMCKYCREEAGASASYRRAGHPRASGGY